MNLSLLITMLTLLVTSVIISQTVFSFLPLPSTVTARRIHTLVAYLALLIAAVHLGLHWSMIMGMVRSRLGIKTASKVRTLIWRALAVLIAGYGAHSLFAVNVGSKLFMQMSFEFSDLQTSTPALFAHHIAIIGLYAFLAHYTMIFLKSRKSRAPARSIVSGGHAP